MLKTNEADSDIVSSDQPNAGDRRRRGPQPGDRAYGQRRAGRHRRTKSSARVRPAFVHRQGRHHFVRHRDRGSGISGGHGAAARCCPASFRLWEPVTGLARGSRTSCSPGTWATTMRSPRLSTHCEVSEPARCSERESCASCPRTAANIAVIGLGAMGLPMATHLADRVLRYGVRPRSSARRQLAAEHGILVEATPEWCQQERRHRAYSPFGTKVRPSPRFLARKGVLASLETGIAGDLDQHNWAGGCAGVGGSGWSKRDTR